MADPRSNSLVAEMISLKLIAARSDGIFYTVNIDGQSVAPTAWIAFSALANLTGLPAASVPIGATADGRPIGLQIMGRHLDDRGVLALAAVVETLYPRSRWPGPVL